MYEPIRTSSVHSVAEPDGPHRSRDEELDIRLAGHLTALLTVTDELRALTPSEKLDDAAQSLMEHSARLRDGHSPLRADPTARTADATRLASLHQRAHTLAGNALVVATAREDAAAELAARCLTFHADALGVAESA